MPAEVVDVELPSGDRVRASVSYYWSDSHAGDRPRSWVVVESIQALETLHEFNHVVFYEGEEIKHYLIPLEIERIKQLIEER